MGRSWGPGAAAVVISTTLALARTGPLLPLRPLPISNTQLWAHCKPHRSRPLISLRLYSIWPAPIGLKILPCCRPPWRRVALVVRFSFRTTRWAYCTRVHLTILASQWYVEQEQLPAHAAPMVVHGIRAVGKTRCRGVRIWLR